uniref:Uncharacterized protein n=1 Tax=Anguilla anguilla TaxID=7936 RepID=A0A0E9WGM3_ANGAN
MLKLIGLRGGLRFVTYRWSGGAPSGHMTSAGPRCAVRCGS